jgi:hypothetical protein
MGTGIGEAVGDGIITSALHAAKVTANIESNIMLKTGFIFTPPAGSLWKAILLPYRRDRVIIGSREHHEAHDSTKPKSIDLESFYTQ